MTYIIGAGMAGCIAAVMNPEATILEASTEKPDNHRAVLRFRSPKVGDVCGIPFKAVTVHKGIWFGGKYVDPNPMLANTYSQKVSGRILDRSIWKTDTVTRYVAPSDFHMQLLDVLYERIQYGYEISSIDSFSINTKSPNQYPKWRNSDVEDRAVISTMPLPTLAKIVGIELKSEAKMAPIHTLRGKVEGCDVHQTVYYPDYNMNVYRATLTGEDLIIESVSESIEDGVVLESLGITNSDVVWESETATQKYGKIAPMDEAERKKIIFELSNKHGIFSLGRFATWRNILLDDIVEDVRKIKKLSSLTGYDLLNHQ